MNLYTVTHSFASIVIQNNGQFVTSIPVRRWQKPLNVVGETKWVRATPTCGEICDFVRRLTVRLNTPSSESINCKISSELGVRYLPAEKLLKAHRTRLSNFRRRRRGVQGRWLSSSHRIKPTAEQR